MKSVFIFTVTLLVVVTAQVNNLRFNAAPITVTPGVPVTTSFYNYQGSQFKLWVPSNISQINFQWTRSAASSECASSAYAYLYGKWASYPCGSYAYPGFDAPCEYRTSFSYSANSPLIFSLNAYDSRSLEYWYSTYEDFIRGDYLYLDSYLDENYNCSATLLVTFDYCGAGTIAASDDTSHNTACVPYTNVSSVNYTDLVTTTSTAPLIKYYLLNLPHDVAGVSITVTKPNTDSLIYIYGRESSGGDSSNSYEYDYSYYNFTLWIANPAAGDFVVTVKAIPYLELANFEVDISIETCPAGIAADDRGACLYPLTHVTTSDLIARTVTVGPADPNDSGYNWSFLAYTVPAETWAFMNLSINVLSGNSYVLWRRNAIPNNNFYDDYFSYSTIINFTPEDFYASKSVTYYFAFSNYDMYSVADFTIQATYQGPSPSPSPSASPSSYPSASPSSYPSSAPSVSPDNNSSSDGPEPSEGVYVLLLVVGFLLGIIVGLILGFYIYSKIQAKRKEASVGYVPLQPFPMHPGMTPVQVPMYPATMN